MRALEAKVPCPNCGTRVRIKIKEMVPGHSKRCPYCEVTFKFGGDDGRKVQRALDDLERTLRRLGR